MWKFLGGMYECVKKNHSEFQNGFFNGILN